MGLACLIPMIIGLVCLMTMMTGTGMKFFEEYQRAGERISAEATEYVRGIPVVKVFQQTVYSFKSFHAAILSYRDLASGYAMMCRMPYTLLTVVLNAMFLFLMPLGMVLIGGAADGWAVLADLVFYIFFAPPACLYDGAADVRGQRTDGGRRGSEQAGGDIEGVALSRACGGQRKQARGQQHFL